MEADKKLEWAIELEAKKTLTTIMDSGSWAQQWESINQFFDNIF